MANKIQIKRTSTSGLLPNTTNSGNTSYIAPGELAINLTDEKMVSSNGSATFEIGANLTNLSVANQITVIEKLQVGDHGVAGYDFGALALIEGDGNKNSYLQFVMQNANTGEFVSSDFVAVSDDGDDTTNYIDMGINGSAYNGPEFGLSGPYDGYLYTSDGNLLLGSIDAKDVIFHTGGANAVHERARITNSGELRVGNTTSNTSITPTTLTTTVITTTNLEVTDTATINTNSITIGNSTVNTIISSSLLDIGGELNANGGVGSAGQVLKSGGSGANAYWDTVSGGTGSPGGTDTQVQFNDASSFGGDAGLTYNKTTDALTVAGSVLVGANVIANTSALLVGNSSVNAVLTQSSFDIDGTIAAGNTTLVGFINVSSTANVGGATTLRSTLTVNGAVTVPNTAALGNTTVTGFINVSSTANVGGATTLRGTATVNGALTVANTAALGNTTVAGFVNVSSTANVGGATNLRGDATVNGALTVANTAALGNTTVTGFINVSSTANVGGATNLRDTLTVNGAVTIANTLGAGNTTITGFANVTTTVSVGANVIANTSALFVGNSSINTSISSASINLGGNLIANGSNGVAGYVLTTSNTGNVYWYSPLEPVGNITHDMTGFLDKSTSTLSVNNSTRTVTWSPTTTSTIFYRGRKIDLSSNLTYTFADTDGGHYINLDEDTLTLYDAGATAGIRDNILVTYVFWDATNNEAIIFGDERHGSNRDVEWHYANHRNLGAVWRSGGGLTYTLDDDTAVSLAVGTPLILADEDLEHTINHAATPNGYYEQVLSGAASLPVLYRNGTSYSQVAGNTVPWLFGTTLAQYNPLSGNSGSLAQADEGDYISYWLVATNDMQNPVKLIVGNLSHNTVDDALGEPIADIGLYFPEFAVMYQIIVQTSTAFTGNTKRVKIVQVRKVVANTLARQTITSGSHDELTGRGDADQHPISSITGLQAITDGLGTMSTQDANNVAITNGTANLSSLTLGANVTANTTTIFTGNSTVNATHTSSLIQVSNSTSTANLTAAGMTIGTVIANTTGLFVGSNVFANSSAFDVGNTTVASALLTLGGQVNANGGVGTSGQVLTSGAAGNVYWSTVSAGAIGGANTQILFNDSGSSNGSAAFIFNKSTNTVVVSNTLQVTNKLQVGPATGYDFSAVAELVVDGNSNSYLQSVTQNSNTGNNASSEFVATADSGNDSVNFVSFGINGSAYNQAAFNIGGPLDAYLYSSNSDLTIGTAANNGAIVFHANGTTSTNEIARINTTGLIVGNTTIASGVLTLGGQVNANGGVGTAGQVLKSGGAGNTYWDTASGGGTPGGSNTQIQFNNSGAFGGSAGFTFDNSTNNITVANTISTANLSVSGVFTLATDSIQVGNSTVNTEITNTDFKKNNVSIVPFGQQTIWVPAYAMYVPATAGAASGSIELPTNDVQLKTLDFDTTTQEFAQFAIQMPKSWDLSGLVARFVWSHGTTTTNFGVAWQIQGYAYSDNTALDTTFGTAQVVTDTGGTTNNLYLSPETADITIGGTPGPEEHIIFRVARVPANGSDNMAIDARLHGVRIHYTTNAASDT